MTQQIRRTWWTHGKSGVVDHVELGAGRIELDLAFGDRRYGVVLVPASGGPAAWRGTWTRRDHLGNGVVSARVYRATDGGLAVIGDWSEDNTVYYWTAELDGAR